jgi:tetratricopeptide (TPR) repeat protein
MSTACEGLYRFLDGELPPEAQDAFRDHLPGCEACALAFQESLQLELLGQMALESPGAAPTAARRQGWGRWEARQGWVAMAALAASLMALMLHRPDPWGEWRASALPRSLEARVAYPEAARGYRGFVPDRGEEGAAAPKAPVMKLGQMARLEAREDFHGVATAHLFNGSPGQARLFLAKLPPSVDRDSDLAVVALQEALGTRAEVDLTLAHLKQRHLDQALELLDGVLRQAPDHLPALWNRALVLRELGLPLLAAESFEAVARQAEPGWGTEAAENARTLREETQRRDGAWRQAFAATRDLMTNLRARLPEAEAHSHPGIVRLAFYDAVRSAPSREDVLRLLPLAQALDGEYGGDVLSGYVWRVADRDFTRRGPLARRYAELALSGKPDSALLEALRGSAEEDLYLGALVYASAAGLPVDREALARLAEAQADPWLRLVAERERALLEVQAGAWWKAEQRLLAALDTCEEQQLVYRCLGLERQLTDLYLGLHRPADAFRHAWTAWQRVRATGEWQYEQQFLQELADVARFQKLLSSARAYLEESLLRMPGDCEQSTHVHRNLARLELEGFRPEGARRAVDRALQCGRPLGLTGALVLSDLARSEHRAGDKDHLLRALAELRRGGVSSGIEALLLFIEGQFLHARGAPEGQALLWRAVELAERTPGDVDARKARAYAYGALVSGAGKAGAWSEALELMGRALRLEPVPEGCVLAVSVQNERTVVLARGREGALRGNYRDTRTEPLRGSAAGLVPPGLVAALRDCGHVDVLALPPVHGLPGLLPGDLAWSYRVGRTEPPPSGPPGIAPRLVVTDVAGPAALGLPRLDGLSPPRLPDPWRVELRGGQATPSRVLEAMVDAGEVELHAHGMTSPAVSDASLVVLAPDRDGSYALTADRVRATRLRRAPLVLLATCGGARTAPFPHEPFSLPVAFIEAGARAVLASSVDIPNSAGGFFEEVRERIRSGTRPSVALKEVRQRWLKAPTQDAQWLPHVLLFE